MRNGFLLVPVLMAALNVRADLVSNSVEYRQGDTVLEGRSLQREGRPAVVGGDEAILLRVAQVTRRKQEPVWFTADTAHREHARTRRASWIGVMSWSPVHTARSQTGDGSQRTEAR
jgi:hypothetical protein